jgi:hypothetical protein
MPNPKTDTGGFSTRNSDEERDMGAKGGPTTSLGSPDSKHGISAPYDEDLTAQMAVKGKKKNKKQAVKENISKNNNSKRSSL